MVYWLSIATPVGLSVLSLAWEIGVQDPLFRVVAGHSLDHAVEQATVLMCAVHKISDLAMVETDHLPTLLTAVHYLSGMAKALAQDDESWVDGWAGG